jgi:hypothetical protein
VIIYFQSRGLRFPVQGFRDFQDVLSIQLRWSPSNTTMICVVVTVN